MGRRANQFLLLLWKNYVLQKRRKLWTVIEIAMPVVFALILIAIRTRVAFKIYPNATVYQDYSLRHLPDDLTPVRPIFPVYKPHFKWEVAYSPKNLVLGKVMDDTMKSLNHTEHISINKATGFDNEEELLKYAANRSMEANSTFLGGIVFVDNFADSNRFPTNITYSIRLKASQINVPISDEISGKSNMSKWKTDELFPLIQVPGPRDINHSHGGEPGYWREGFLSLQNAIDKAILYESNVTTSNITVNMQRFPYPPYNDDLFILVIQSQLPILLLISYILNALDITRGIVQEKEKKLKESMKMMGLNNWLHWLAWFTKCFLFLAISTFFMTLLFWVKVGDKGSVISNSDPTVIFVFFLCFSLATVSLCFAVSVFFSKANTAAVVMGVLWFFTYLPYMFLINQYSTLSRGAKFGACLLSNTAMAFGAFIIGLFEGTGEGVQWSNITRPISVDDNFTFLDVLVMLIGDAILYGVITWYVEAVFPGEFGIPRKWYFPVTKSYWFGTQITDRQLPEYEDNRDSKYFEKDPVVSVAGIQIKKLKKVFNRTKVAVNEISLNVFEGQITALLGHNGAGKTTTMSMLTGLFPPSEGTATVNGYDIRKDIDGVRSSLGLCPQHDVLFDDLTVEEHLYFFAKLKNCPKGLVKAEVDKYISSLELKDKRHVRSKALSGGMKRKLSVGIALIADSKIIMLDEPTSGMDPAARRFTWDILQRHRAGRTILLTTHHMDEADLLGDRIAIMAEGELQCCGSSLFLKNRYGVGYHMTISKGENCKVAEIKDLIYASIANSEMENNIGNELTFILPNNEVTKFEGLFNTMEKRRQELGIRSYGVSVTTMEEVFLKVGNQSRFMDNDDSSGYRSNATSISGDENLSVDRPHVQKNNDETTPLLSTHDPEVGFAMFGLRNVGIALYIQQFYGMFVKRIIHTRRNLLVTVSQILIPLIYTMFALLAVNSFPQPTDLPALVLKPMTYGENTVLYCHDNHTEQYSRYTKAFAEQFSGTETTVKDLNEESANCNMVQSIVSKSTKDTVTFNERYLIAAVFKKSTKNGDLNGTAFFNNQPWHTPGIALNAYSNALLKASLNSSYSLRTINHPLPRSVSEKTDDEINNGFTTGFVIAFDMVFGMSILASTFVVFLIKERASKAKHIQFVSGVHITNFWLSTFLWDLINYTLTSVLILFVFVAFGVEAYTEAGRIGYVFLLLVLYGWGIIPLMYLFSFLFKTPSVGFVRMTIFNILFGTTAFLAVEILEMPELNLMNVGNVLHWIFLFSPSFCLAKAMNDIYINHQYLEICNSSPFATAFCTSDPTSISFNKNYLGWETPGIGRELVFLAIAGAIYFLLVLVIEMGAFRLMWYLWFPGKKSSPKTCDEVLPGENIIQDDEDVLREQERIMNTDMNVLRNTDALIIKELRKVYPKKGGQSVVVAVDNMCLGVPLGECFGLLGINGAGKTTTFNMLTGDVQLSGGDAFIEQFSVKYNISEVQQNIGYCPQFDALIDQMTGRETLVMYARLRGLPETIIRKEVQRLLSLFNLDEHADKQTKTYSGGNKRKLSTAIALIGDPPVVFLDEPSTGMDPATRRLLWDSICKIRASGRSIILTSHSMDECEALCTRLAIMVNGKFKCLGSIQHLKSRFGEGYTLLAKVAPDSSGQNLQQLKVFIEEKFPGSKLKDEHEGLVHYHVCNSDLSWAFVFGTMEKAKSTYNIEDYSVSQTTLEQVFLNFARNQRDEDD